MKVSRRGSPRQRRGRRRGGRRLRRRARDGRRTRGRPPRRADRRRRRRVVPLPRRPPGRHRHPRPGPAALRGVRPDHRLARGGRRPAEGLDRRGRADDAGQGSRTGRADRGRRRPAARRHRRGDRAAARGADHHVRLRSRVLREARPRATDGPPRWRTCRTSPATTSTRPAPGATSACRPARRTRRWPCTPIRNLARIGFGTVAVRWSQLGFGRTSTTSTSQSTPRNLFGFKDGTANVKAEETDALDEHVWVGADDDPAAADWLAGGSLPRRPPDQHDDRGLGPPAAGGPGGLRRPHQGQRRPALRRRGDVRAGLLDARPRRPGHPEGRAHPRSCTRPRTTACGCCAAATTSSTAPTRSAGWTPGCSSSPSCATRVRQFVPVMNRMAQEGRARGVPEVHVVGAVRGAPGHGPGRARRPGPVRLTMT